MEVRQAVAAETREVERLGRLGIQLWRKSSDGSKDRGKDRLKALAAAAARAAGANLTTYFADDDSRSPRGRRFDYEKTS